MARKQKFVTNSDIKDRQRFEILKNNQRADVVGVKLEDGKEFQFGQGNAFYVDDPGMARALHDEFGQGGSQDITVVPIEKGAKGRVRTWVVPAMPWHKDKEK